MYIIKKKGSVYINSYQGFKLQILCLCKSHHIIYCGLWICCKQISRNVSSSSLQSHTDERILQPGSSDGGGRRSMVLLDGQWALEDMGGKRGLLERKQLQSLFFGFEFRDAVLGKKDITQKTFLCCI